MKFKKPRIAWSVGCIIGCAFVYGCDSPSKRQSTVNAPTSTRLSPNITSGSRGELPSTPGSPTIRIPLESVVSTSGQAMLQRPVPSKGPTPSLNGASNVYLVDAATITDAVQASTRVEVGAFTADIPSTLNMPDPPRGNYWLVVFLGIRGSNPIHWLVDSVTLNGNQIRFSYHQKGSGSETKDLHRYRYWVPLGILGSGVYNLELYNTDLKAVTLMRRVKVTPLKP